MFRSQMLREESENHWKRKRREKDLGDRIPINKVGLSIKWIRLFTNGMGLGPNGQTLSVKLWILA